MMATIGIISFLVGMVAAAPRLVFLELMNANQTNIANTTHLAASNETSVQNNGTFFGYETYWVYN